MSIFQTKSIMRLLVLPGFLLMNESLAQDIDPTGDSALKPRVDNGLSDRYQLVWSDEFSGSEIDESKWEFRLDTKHWSAQMARNIDVSDGVCRIMLRKEPVNGKEYTGGGIITRKYFGYGYYEARIRVPSSAGWHTSFWMMDNHHAHNDTSQIELDPLENDSIDLHSFSTDYHQWRSDIGHMKRYQLVKTTEDDPLSDWHVYGMEWTPEAAYFYFDGKLVRTAKDLTQQLSKADKAAGKKPIVRKASEIDKNDVQIWFTSIATWLGDTEKVDDAALPASAQCDYVRFFSATACAVDGGISRKAKQRPNILFIGIDDLRTELGCYGSQIAVTPNIDKLASEGLLFERAYCQQPICGPSRASLMSGGRPDTIGITHNYVKLRELNPDILTLPQHLAKYGYETVYCGKIFHHGDLDPASWNRQPAIDRLPAGTAPSKDGFALEKNRKIKKETRREMFARYGEVARYGLAMGPAYECADVPDNTYIDGYHTDLAIATLQELAEEGRPFFLGFGMNKPHLNWAAPKKYWDLYDREQIPLTKQSDGPEDGALVGQHPSFELRVRAGIPKVGNIPDEQARTLKHAYLACVSYVDAQIGRMITALEKAGLRDNTVIILWSDHGFHLGEMGMWCKATNYELSTRVPMMIWTPGMPSSSQGKTTDALVELVDMYPTLCDLIGIEQPAHLEGTSFAPLLENPDREWKSAAFSQFPSPALREWGGFPIRPAMRETYFGPLLAEVEERIKDQMGEKWDRDLFENHLMGYAMRTDRYRLIAWMDTRFPEAAPLFVELYDHETDPQETRNIAARQPALVKTLLARLDEGWKGARPAPAE